MPIVAAGKSLHGRRWRFRKSLQAIERQASARPDKGAGGLAPAGTDAAPARVVCVERIWLLQSSSIEHPEASALADRLFFSGEWRKDRFTGWCREHHALLAAHITRTRLPSFRSLLTAHEALKTARDLEVQPCPDEVREVVDGPFPAGVVPA